MNNLLKLIKNICGRPGLYVARSGDIWSVELYLGGYQQALLDTGNLEEKYSFNNFTNWLQVETKSIDRWDQILVQLYGSDDEAVKNLPEKYNQFINQK